MVALVLAEVPESVDPNYEDYSMNVYILNQKTLELHLLAKNAVEPVWSPDGHRLAYLSSDNWRPTNHLDLEAMEWLEDYLRA